MAEFASANLPSDKKVINPNLLKVVLINLPSNKKAISPNGLKMVNFNEHHSAYKLYVDGHSVIV